MAHYEPPHLDLHYLQIELFLFLVRSINFMFFSLFLQNSIILKHLSLRLSGYLHLMMGIDESEIQSNLRDEPKFLAFR